MLEGVFSFLLNYIKVVILYLVYDVLLLVKFSFLLGLEIEVLFALDYLLVVGEGYYVGV